MRDTDAEQMMNSERVRRRPRGTYSELVTLDDVAYKHSLDSIIKMWCYIMIIDLIKSTGVGASTTSLDGPENSSLTEPDDVDYVNEWGIFITEDHGESESTKPSPFDSFVWKPEESAKVVYPRYTSFSLGKKFAYKELFDMYMTGMRKLKNTLDGIYSECEYSKRHFGWSCEKVEESLKINTERVLYDYREVREHLEWVGSIMDTVENGRETTGEDVVQYLIKSVWDEVENCLKICVPILLRSVSREKVRISNPDRLTLAYMKETIDIAIKHIKDGVKPFLILSVLLHRSLTFKNIEENRRGGVFMLRIDINAEDAYPSIPKKLPRNSPSLIPMEWRDLDDISLLDDTLDKVLRHLHIIGVPYMDTFDIDIEKIGFETDSVIRNIASFIGHNLLRGKVPKFQVELYVCDTMMYMQFTNSDRSNTFRTARVSFYSDGRRSIYGNGIWVETKRSISCNDTPDIVDYLISDESWKMPIIGYVKPYPKDKTVWSIKDDPVRLNVPIEDPSFKAGTVYFSEQAIVEYVSQYPDIKRPLRFEFAQNIKSRSANQVLMVMHSYVRLNVDDISVRTYDALYTFRIIGINSEGRLDFLISDESGETVKLESLGTTVCVVTK